MNRRYTGYLTRRNNIPVFLYFSESSADNGQVALEPCPTGIEAPMPSWLLGHLAKNPHLLKCLAEDPFGFIAIIEGKLLANWSAFFARLTQDIEAAVSKGYRFCSQRSKTLICHSTCRIRQILRRLIPETSKSSRPRLPCSEISR